MYNFSDVKMPSLSAIYSVIMLAFVMISTTVYSGDTSSGCSDGSSKGFQDHLHPSIAACTGTWVGHIENASSLCAPGWQVCGWKDEQRLKNITWKEATNITGCYAINAAHDSGSCRACNSNLKQNELAGIGSQCTHQSYGEVSCISGGKISVSCCGDSQYKDTCKYRPGLSTGVMCCKKQGIAPQIFVHPQSLTHVTTGVTFVLSCQATGEPTPTVKWLKNGQPLPRNSSRISEFTSGYLLISSSAVSDTGTYQCVVTNSEGDQTVDANVLVTDHKSGCADGTTDGLEQYEDIQACKGSWRGHVKRGKHLCKKGWHVCNPKHEAYLKLLTWSDVTELDGCYAYNAMNTYSRCQRCHQEDMAGIGKNCGKIRRGSGTCLAQGQIEVYEKQKGRGCNYDPEHISGVMCCKRPKRQYLLKHKEKGSKCTPRCQNGGVCVGKNKCECRKGYKGAWCQHPVCYGGCVPNSYCIKPDVCRCYSGYTFNGEKCSQKDRKKTKERKTCQHPCFNGGHCKHGHCKCPKPYYGKMCQHGGKVHVLIIEKSKVKKSEKNIT